LISLHFSFSAHHSCWRDLFGYIQYDAKTRQLKDELDVVQFQGKIAFCKTSFVTNYSQMYIKVVIHRMFSDVKCTLCSQHGFICKFSLRNHHKMWPSPKTTIIKSNLLCLNCTLCVAKECWVAKLVIQNANFSRNCTTSIVGGLCDFGLVSRKTPI